MNVPKLRFKEFDGSWEVKKIDDIADLTSSKRVYLSDYVNEGIPFYRGKEISELKRNEKPKDILYITRAAYEAFKSSYGVPHVNDILITAVGTLGNVYRIKNDSEFYFKDGNLIWFRSVKISSPFLEILLETNQEAIQKSSIGSTQRALTIVELKKLKLNVPYLPEQTKIANFLTAVDEKTTQLTQKCDLLAQYKKGVMQQIFSQQLRFKDDDGRDFPVWETVILGNICDVRDGTHDSPKYLANGYPLITSKNLLENGGIDLENVSLISEIDFININKRSKVDCGDILFGMIGTIGNPVLVITSNFAIKNVALIKQKEKLKNTFLVHYLKSSNILRQFDNLTVGNTQKFISLGNLRQLEIQLPSENEQTKIANFLTAIDDKINNTQAQLAAVKQYKQGLLQQLFV